MKIVLKIGELLKVVQYCKISLWNKQESSPTTKVVDTFIIVLVIGTHVVDDHVLMITLHIQNESVLKIGIKLNLTCDTWVIVIYG